MNKSLQEKKHMPLFRSETLRLVEYVKTLPLRDRTIIMAILTIGLTTSEVERLNIGDIGFQNYKRGLFVHERYEKKKRFRPLTDEQYKVLKPYMDTKEMNNQNNKKPLFSSTAKNSKGKRLSVTTITGICKETLKAIGLDDRAYSAISLMHTAEVLPLYEIWLEISPMVSLTMQDLQETKWTYATIKVS